MSEQQVNQTGLKDVSVGRDINANIDQSVNKTVIHQAPKVNPPIPNNVPPSSVNFVGREAELQDIHAKLQAGQGVSVCAVEGMGGLGKSELARRYAWEYRQEYAARYWFSLREGRLADEVVKLAKSGKLDLPEVMKSQTVEAQAEWCWQNWTPTEGKVLVILDDVTNLASIPEKARPMADRFQILVTTRKRKLSSQFADIPLGVMSEAEALELLAKLVGEARVTRELIAAKSICESLGYLPLGVELAGRYLQLDEDLSLSDYRQRLTISDESLDLQEAEEINATRGVIAAFELSWQELSASTGKVAMLLGLFAPEIAWGLVEEVSAQLINVADLREGRKQLNNLYLIKAIDQKRTHFALHPLVREFFRYKLVISDSITKQNVYDLVLGIIKNDVVLAKSLVVSELEKFNPFFDNSIKSIDYARLIKESKRAWYKGFGGLIQIIGTTRPDGSLPKIGAYIYDSDEDSDSKNILCAEYCGEEYGEYFELTEEIVSLYRQEQFSVLFENKKFLSFSSSFRNKR